MIKRLLIGIYLIGTCFSIASAILPEKIGKTLNEHRQELQDLLTEWNESSEGRCMNYVTTREWLPGYIIKYGIERVTNAKKVDNAIRKYHLNLLFVPRKYVYQVLDQGSVPTNKNSIVIAEKIEGSKREKWLNLKQTEQLCCLATKAPHYDMHCGNFIVMDDDKICIIDTDAFAMDSTWELFKRSLAGRGRCDKRILLHRVLGIITGPVFQLERYLSSRYKVYDNVAREFVLSGKKRRQLMYKSTLGGMAAALICIAGLRAKLSSTPIFAVG